jgi:hypothetical protein
VIGALARRLTESEPPSRNSGWWLGSEGAARVRNGCTCRLRLGCVHHHVPPRTVEAEPSRSSPDARSCEGTAAIHGRSRGRLRQAIRPNSPATFDPCSPRRTPEREDRRQAVGNGFSGAPLGPRGVILRHGLAREHELAKIQRRVWPQRDSHAITRSRPSASSTRPNPAPVGPRTLPFRT